MTLLVWLPGPLFLLGVSVPGSIFLLRVFIEGCVSVQGSLCPEDDLCPWGLCPGGLCPGGVSVGTPPPPNQKSGWYTSYWNAFLLCFKI